VRILIAGSPRSGKTTLGQKLAKKHNAPLRSTDDLIGLGWSEASAEAAKWLDEPGPWVIEGVAVPRALRKWLETRQGRGKPADALVWLDHARTPLSAGQAAMAKGCRKVMDEIAPRVSGILRAPGAL
jgi:adenylate kinase family enzyme